MFFFSFQVLGFVHMHQVQKRDNYVEIKWKNIEEKWTEQFCKASEGNLYDRNFDYDFGSIMQYPKDAYAILDFLLSIKVLVNKKHSISTL